MPLYIWKCSSESCNNEFEAKVSLAEFDTKKVMCDKCGNEATRKITAMPVSPTSWKIWRA